MVQRANPFLQVVLLAVVSTTLCVSTPVSAPWTQAHALSSVTRGILDSIFGPGKEDESTPPTSDSIPSPTPLMSSPEAVAESSVPPSSMVYPTPVSETPPTFTEPTPQPPSTSDSAVEATPEPASNNLGASGTGTASTATAGVSLLTVAIIAIAVIVPAFIVYSVARRRANTNVEGFETMPPTTQANTYSGTARRSDSFSVGDE